MVFSSGVLNTYEMKQKFNATLVGQPTGQGVNHFGETKTFKLPNSKIKIKYSSKFFQLIDDTANSIKPDIVIEPTIDDYLTGNDPVINYCLAQ
jgi:hypothetical protein